MRVQRRKTYHERKSRGEFLRQASGMRRRSNMGHWANMGHWVSIGDRASMGHRQRRVSWTAAKEVVQSQQLRLGALSPQVLTRRSLQLKPEKLKTQKWIQNYGTPSSIGILVSVLLLINGYWLNTNAYICVAGPQNSK